MTVAKKATPHQQLLDELLDSRIPKNEREHAAVREIERLRQAIAEAEAEKQEPVGRFTGKFWTDDAHSRMLCEVVCDIIPTAGASLYTHPQPKREWVGLTDAEFEQLLIDAKFTRSDLLMIGACVEDICNMVQAKLKEKNA